MRSAPMARSWPGDAMRKLDPWRFASRRPPQWTAPAGKPQRSCLSRHSVLAVLCSDASNGHGEAGSRFPSASPGGHFMRLDGKSVAALKLGGKTDVIFFDDTLPCFGYRLRLSHDRTEVLRSWVVQYKRAGATRRITLGSAEVLSAEPARTAAKKVLARVHLGEAPAADRRERREKDRLSFRSQVDEYLAVKVREVRPTTLREVTRYLTGPYFKPLHGMAIDKVSRKDVASRLVAISRGHGDTVAAK